MAINIVRSTDWVDNVTRYIAEESGARQVVLITKLAGNKGITSPIINEVFVKLGQRLPVVRINQTDDQEEVNTSCVDAAGNPIPLTTMATFFLLVHDFRDVELILPSTSFIDAVAEMSSFDYHPRYLLLSVVPVLTKSLEEFLQYAWTKKMLDLTILQWVEEKVSRHFPINKDEFSLPIVHQFNPFKLEYRRSNWSNGDDLFPNKVDNLAGYPLRVRVPNSPPFSVSEFNEFEEPISISGANVLLIQSIARKLNASLKYLPAKRSKDLQYNKPSDWHTFYFAAGEASHLDISTYLHTRVSTSRCDSLRTMPITVDELCAVVPILSSPKRFDSRELLAAFLSSFGIVLVYWIVAKVLRLPVLVGRPFIIARVFLGVSVPHQPRKTAERVMLASLLLISFIYSSSIYTALTSVSVWSTDEMAFESIEDLDNSGLIPLMKQFNLKKTFHDAEGALKNLIKKSNGSQVPMIVCAQWVARWKNVTCFVEKFRAAVLVARSRTNGHLTMKLAKPCFWSDSVAFDLGKRSPYRSSINIIIGRMQSAGLINKLYADVEKEAVERNADEDVGVLEGQQSMIALRRQFLTVAICCYTISILVFIGEIVLHRVLKHIKSRRQAVVHIPNSNNTGRRRIKNVSIPILSDI